jgi:hypothetical protein
VKSLVDNELIERPISIIWTGRDDKGNRIAEGVYFVKLNISGRAFTKKIVKKKPWN